MRPVPAIPPASAALVFVYGTLRPGGSNHFRMAGARWLGPAVAHGTLYRVNWYPGLVLDPDGAPVTGDLFEVPIGEIPALDDYEGPQYRRIRTAVKTATGEPLEAWIWEWNESTEKLAPVPGGDWLAQHG